MSESANPEEPQYHLRAEDPDTGEVVDQPLSPGEAGLFVDQAMRAKTGINPDNVLRDGDDLLGELGL